MSHWTIYWVLILDSLKLTATLASFLLGVGLVIALVIWIAASCECKKYSAGEEDYFVRRISKIFSWILGPIVAISLLFAVFVPNTKQAVAIWVTPKIVNNEQVQEIPQKGLKVLDKKLESYLDELKKEEDK